MNRPTIVYRFLPTAEATLRDFESPEALGRLPRRPLRGLAARAWSGISVLDSLDAVRSTHRVSPYLGDFVAVLDLTAVTDVVMEQTFRDHHWTIWAPAASLLAVVIRIMPIFGGSTR